MTIMVHARKSMMRSKTLMFLATVAALGVAARGDAQLLPGGGGVSLPPVGGTVGQVGGIVEQPLGSVAGSARDTVARLAATRLDRLQDLVRSAPDLLEMTRLGPAVRGELVAMDLTAEQVARLEAEGFAVTARETIEGVDIPVTRLRVPGRVSLDTALRRAQRLAPAASISANTLHLPNGVEAIGESAQQPTQGGRARSGPTIGIIDGGVAPHPALSGPIQQRAFAGGAVRPSGHGTAIASLIAGSGPVRGSAPGARLIVADIFGGDARGGNALVLAQAIGWMVSSGARVVAVSLGGPDNPLVARAVTAARARGTYIVASVGNDGPAAPPVFPASYPDVVSVTGVDGRGRVLIEAGRTPSLDYAAPGADMAAAGPNGRVIAVRGTSFAVPLVAGRLAQHLGGGDPLAALDGEAQRGRGYGRGLVCGACRTPVPAR